MGKSSIAAHVEDRLRSEYDTGHVVDVAELPACLTSDMIRSIAVSMGVTEHTLATLDQTVCDAIGSTPTLLVIETAEVAAPAVADVVQRLSAALGLHILVTSQVPIRSIGEHVVRVEPLDPQGAMTMLAGAHHQGEQHDEATLLKICEQLDFVPLALELAATQLQALGPTETLRQLRRGVVTESESPGRPARQRSSMRTAAWGIERATPDERRLLERLGAHTAPFTLRTVRHGWGDSERTSDDVERAFVGLIDRSLVHRVDDGAEYPRYHLLDTVRSSVRSSATDMTPHSARLTDVVLDTAQAALFGIESALTLDELIGELVPALDRLHTDNDPRELGLAGCLSRVRVSTKPGHRRRRTARSRGCHAS